MNACVSSGLRARRHGVNGPEQNARNPARAGRDVALRAIQLGALEYRMIALAFVQNVEDRSLHRIERNELQHLAVMHLADIHVVVEVQRARRLRRDFLVLEAGLGKDQRLRFDGDLQLLEHRLQIAVLAVHSPALRRRDPAALAVWPPDRSPGCVR